MLRAIFSFILLLFCVSLSQEYIELSPVELQVEVISKKHEKRIPLKPPETLEPFDIKLTTDLKKRIQFTVINPEKLPFMETEKPKSYLGIPQSNAKMAKIIEEFHKGDYIFAKAEAEEFIKKHKDSKYIFYAHYILGYINFSQGNYRQAAEEFSTSCQLNPAVENCVSAAVVYIQLGDFRSATEVLQQGPQEENNLFFLNLINYLQRKGTKLLDNRCDRVDPAFMNYCNYTRKYIYFLNSDYEKAIKINIKKEDSLYFRQSTLIDGISLLYLGKNEDAARVFKDYLEKVSVTDNLSNIAYYGLGIADERQTVPAAQILQTRDEELSQDLYIRLSVKLMQQKDYLRAFLYFQSALKTYESHKDDILKNVAVCMYNLQNYSYAKGLLKNIADRTKDPRINLYAAYAAYQLKDYREAEKYFLRTVDVPHYTKTALEFLADIYLQLREYEDFVETAYRLRNFDQDKAYNLLGWYFFEKGDYRNAFRSFRDSYMKAVSAYNLGDTKTAIQILKDEKDERYQILKAYANLKEHNIEQARQILQKIKDRDSRVSQEASYLYAFTYYIEGNFQRAAEEFTQFYTKYASKNDDLVRKAFLRIADSYYSMGYLEMARKLYSDFISAYVGTEDSLNAAYSLVQLETGESDPDPVSALENFLANNPEYPLHHILKLQLAYVYTKSRRYQEAERIYSDIASKNPGLSKFALQELIKVYVATGDLNKAEKYALEFIKKYPDSQETINIKTLLAQVYEKQDRLDDALSIYRQLHNSDQIKLSIARILQKKKDFNKAREYLAELYRTYPDNREIALQLGKVCYNLSLYQEAEGYLQEASKSDIPEIAAEGYYYLGMIEKTTDGTKALNSFLNSIYINPELDETNINSRFEAAQILISQDRRKEASCLLKEVLKYNDDQIKQRAENIIKDLPKCVY